MSDTPIRTPKVKILLRVFFSLLLFLVLGENTSRTVLKSHTTVSQDERNLAYNHHERLGWFPKPNSQTQFTGMVTIDVQHNSWGFRDKEFSEKSKARLAFLGDSFVWGYDAQEPERFTNLIAENHPEWDILNLGVSGYGTDQAFLLLQESWDTLQLDSVILTVSYNDVHDNNHNWVYGGYYKPFYQLTDQGLLLQGTPVPKSMNYRARDNWLLGTSAFARLAFHYYRRSQYPEQEARGYEVTFAVLRAFQSFLKKNETPFLIVLQAKDQKLKDFFKKENIPVVDVSEAEQFQAFGKHWTPKGNKQVAQKLEARFKTHPPLR